MKITYMKNRIAETYTQTELTLKLFNCVVKTDKTKDFGTFDFTYGFFVMPDAMYAYNEISKYFVSHKLNGNDLNKTFHKSWEKIQKSSRLELLIEQITHYMSTYGTNFEGEVYIPDEVLDIPDVILPVKIIHSFTEKEIIDKCLNMLSGVALEQNTIVEVLTLLDMLNFDFKSYKVKNKEASVILADQFGVFPEDPVDVLRYCVYKSTGDSLLIKNKKMIEDICNSSFSPIKIFKSVGLEKMATIFNRFKPIFLAYKGFGPRTINKISKLSKTYHKPLVENPLNYVTSRLIQDSDLHWLENATPFALMRALNSCVLLMQGKTNHTYHIRNGKSFTQTKEIRPFVKTSTLFNNISIIKDFLVKKFGNNKKVYIPNHIKYGLPVSQKKFIGNYPDGTKIINDRVIAGVYWKDSWGARDLDLSGVTQSGIKVGWNGDYRSNSLLYSGDVTSAPRGAVEYLYTEQGDVQVEPTLVFLNVFSGQDKTKFKIIIGKGHKNLSRDYMMNPENLIFECEVETVQNQNYIGLIYKEDSSNNFVYTLFNKGSGSVRVSRSNKYSNIATNALIEEYKYGLTFNDILVTLGYEIVENEAECDINLSPTSVSKETFLEFFKSE